MPEEILFEMERSQSREEIAEYLRTVANALESGDPMSFKTGGESVTVEPPANPVFEIEVEREGPTEGSGEISIEFEIEWNEGETETEDLVIE